MFFNASVHFVFQCILYCAGMNFQIVKKLIYRRKTQDNGNRLFLNTRSLETIVHGVKKTVIKFRKYSIRKINLPYTEAMNIDKHFIVLRAAGNVLFSWMKSCQQCQRYLGFSTFLLQLQPNSSKITCPKRAGKHVLLMQS